MALAGFLVEINLLLMSTWKGLEWSQWVDYLPHSLLAVFAPAGGDLGAARRVHSAFHAAYQGQLEESAAPLLVYDPGNGPRTPFRMA